MKWGAGDDNNNSDDIDQSNPYTIHNINNSSDNTNINDNNSIMKADNGNVNVNDNNFETLNNELCENDNNSNPNDSNIKQNDNSESIFTTAFVDLPVQESEVRNLIPTASSPAGDFALPESRPPIIKPLIPREKTPMKYIASLNFSAGSKYWVSAMTGRKVITLFADSAADISIWPTEMTQSSELIELKQPFRVRGFRGQDAALITHKIKKNSRFWTRGD